MRVDEVAGNGPDRYSSPRDRVPFNSRNEGAMCVSMTRRAMGLADIARHVIWCRLTPETRALRAFDDVASSMTK